MLNKTLLGLSLAAAFSFSSSPVFAVEYLVVVPAPGKAASYASIKLELNPASLPVGYLSSPYTGFDFNTALKITGDPDLDVSQVAWSKYSGSLPAGLMLTGNGGLSGTPTEDGLSSFQVLARYKTKSTVGTYAVGVEAETQLIEQGGVRYWEDGTYAPSCLEYRQPTMPYAYAGTTGDGIYRIEPNGSLAFEVYCDMTSEGGGWTLLMKQAKGDGTTLQGDTTYWVNGTLLNDTAANQSMADGNLVSAAFGSLPVNQFLLRAANESTMQQRSNSIGMTAHAAFSNSNRLVYQDGFGSPQRYPDWFIRTTAYPAGQAITTSRLGFNFIERSTSTDQLMCGARWGWASNNDPANVSAGTHDVCGGLGAYGAYYGLQYMNSDRNAWQPATLYLWGK